MDYYEEARKIAALLRAEGLEPEARAVEDAIDGGATASEILMGIRFHLEEAVPKSSETTAQRIQSLAKEVTKALS